MELPDNHFSNSEVILFHDRYSHATTVYKKGEKNSASYEIALSPPEVSFFKIRHRILLASAVVWYKTD